MSKKYSCACDDILTGTYVTHRHTPGGGGWELESGGGCVLSEVFCTWVKTCGYRLADHHARTCEFVRAFCDIGTIDDLGSMIIG